MATLDGINVTALSSGANVEAAVAFELTETPKADRLLRFPSSDWECDIKRGNKRVVLRCARHRPETTLLNEAIELAQRFLDVVSVEGDEHLTLDMPGDNHVLVYASNGLRVLRYVALAVTTATVSVQIKVVDSNGIEKPRAEPPPPDWIEAFRYYRLAHTSPDLFEAYRNAYLSFESLLSVLVPLKREREELWLRHALQYVEPRLIRHTFTPAGASFEDHFIDTQYKAIRVQLFHAKTGRSALPGTPLDYRRVGEALDSLLRLWSDVARDLLPLHASRAVLTNAGAAATLEALIGAEALIITAEVPECDVSLTSLDARGIPFAETRYETGHDLGRCVVSATVHTAQLPTDLSIRQLVIVLGGQPYSYANIDGLLTLGDVDVFVFEQRNVIRNAGSPRAS